MITSIRIWCSKMLPVPQMLQKCVGVLTGSLSCEKRNEQGGWELSEFPEHCSCSPAGTSYSSLDLTLSNCLENQDVLPHGVLQ